MLIFKGKNIELKEEYLSQKIRLGIMGGGGLLIGVVHRIAAEMFDRYRIVGRCSSIPLPTSHLPHTLRCHWTGFTTTTKPSLRKN